MEFEPEKPIVVKLQKSGVETVGKIFSIIFRSILFLILFFFLIGLMSMGGQTEVAFERATVDFYGNSVPYVDSQPIVALIPIRGTIANQRSQLFEEIPSETILQMLEVAQKDPNVAAIVLRIDSPGGTVLDSEKIALKVQEAKKTKPVYAYLENTAASGGYFIASQADKIIAWQETITGSIGVILQVPNFAELMEDIGIEMITITSGNLKSLGSPYDQFTPEERAIFQDLVDESYERFVDYVATGRGLEESAVREVADGRIISGRQALEFGLVDSTGGLEELQKTLAEADLANANLLEFYVPASPFSNLTGGFSALLDKINPSANQQKLSLFYL
jgi:protease-4